MKIRKANPKDFEEIAKIMMKESSKKPYYEKYNLKTSLKEVKKLSKNELYVATENKETVGFIASSITSDNKEKAYIDELWLKNNWQGKGIGKNLMKFIEELYKKKGIKIIRLVAKRNAGAFKFYKKIKYNENKELVFMEKKLK